MRAAPIDSSALASYQSEADRLQATSDSHYASYALWSSGQMSAECVEGAKRFSYGYDYTIRQYYGGATFDELVASQDAHTVDIYPDPDWRRSEAIQHVLEAIDAAHAIERAFYEASEEAADRVTSLFRGIGGLSDEVLNRFLAEDEFDFQGKPSSTSASIDVANGFMMGGITGKEGRDPGHGIVFALTRRSKAVPIEAISDVGTEREYVLHGNTRWRITGRRRHHDIGPYQRWLIEAEEVL